MALDKTILVVEDDDIVRMLTIDVLEELGYQVNSAETANNALEQLAHQHFDLLLTDLNLPDMAGTDMATTVRKTHPNLPILFASGYLQGDELSCPSALSQNRELQGPLGVIGKPFTIEQLRNKVGELLSSNQQLCTCR